MDDSTGRTPEDRFPAAETARLDRRSLLRGAAVAAAGLGLSSALAGVAEADPGTGKAHGHDRGNGRGPHRVQRGAISIQLFTLRSILATDLEGTLASLGSIGYRKVEPAGFHGRTAAQFRAALDRAGLHATSSHNGLTDDWQAVLDDAHTLGQRFIVVPFAQFGTADEWKRFAEQLDATGARTRAAGLSLGYHNHAHEFQRLPTGELPYDIVTATDPDNVHLEVDLYWAVTGGVDPVELIRRHRGRIRQFHVKDRAADGGFADLGTGTIDFARIFRNTKEAAVREYIVEHDQPASPLSTARVGFDYLRDLRF